MQMHYDFQGISWQGTIFPCQGISLELGPFTKHSRKPWSWMLKGDIWAFHTKTPVENWLELYIDFGKIPPKKMG